MQSTPALAARNAAHLREQFGISDEELARRARQAGKERYWAVTRHAKLARRMPGWAKPEAMVDVYAKAALVSETSGERHDADHIVPLRSPLVCGLHCEQNLQVLTHTENLSKGNRRWPDMP